MRKLENKTVLITGCNRGIGKAILEKFVQEGANVVACTRKLTTDLKEWYTLQETENDIKIFPLVLDLSDEKSIKEAMKELYSWRITIDILINNAGMAAGGLLLMTSMSKLKEVFQINYFSQILITQYVLKLMMKQHAGNILFMSSVLGLDARPGATAYGASKAAIALLTRSLSKEVGAYNIRVNALAPNLVDTDMANLMEKNFSSEIINGASIKRMAKVSEIANTALFLCSEDSSYITGQVIRVDGGL